MEFHTAGVIGGGAWGTALAQSAAAAGLAVVLQAREPEVIESIRTRRMNDAFLPGIELDAAINVTSSLADLADCDLILAVPPAHLLHHHQDLRGEPISKAVAEAECE